MRGPAQGVGDFANGLPRRRKIRVGNQGRLQFRVLSQGERFVLGQKDSAKNRPLHQDPEELSCRPVQQDRCRLAFRRPLGRVGILHQLMSCRVIADLSPGWLH
jgi:hypothetical protein